MSYRETQPLQTHTPKTSAHRLLRSPTSSVTPRGSRPLQPRARQPSGRRRTWIVIALLVAASAAAVQGLWIPAKAVLAQHLMQRSWQEAMRGEPAPPPWPWADTTPVARLRLPRLEVDQLVLAGASGAELAFGPGLVTEASLLNGDGVPENGLSNIAIAGHRDTHFRFMRHIAIGDRLLLESANGAALAYAVEWTGVVAEDATWVASPTLHDALTLITCYPFDGIAGQADQRFVVRANRVPHQDVLRLAYR